MPEILQVPDSDLPLHIIPGYGLEPYSRSVWEKDWREQNLEQLMGKALVWKMPSRAYSYVISADVGEGIGKDRSVAQVTRLGTVEEPEEQVCEYVSDSIDPIDFAGVIDALGRFYKDSSGTSALCAVEVNNHGLATQRELSRHLGYDNFYIWQVEDSADPSKRFTNRVGFYTNRATRPPLIQLFVKKVKTVDPNTGIPDYKINSPFLYEELRSFQTLGALFEAEAEAGAHDDCIPADSLIQTVNGMKAIVDIVPGDLVLTHKGRFRKVLRTGNRYSNTICEVKASGRVPFRLTSTHKIHVMRWYRQSSGYPLIIGDSVWRSPSELSLDDPYATTTPISKPEEIRGFSIDLANYAPSTYKIEGDRLIAYTYLNTTRPRRNPKQNPVNRWLDIGTPEFARILGYFAAEGSYGAHSIQFASHREELPIRKWLASKLFSYGLHPCTVASSDNGSALSFGSIIYRNYFKEAFGGTKENKRLPKEVLEFPVVLAIQVLVGYLVGDGSMRNGSITSATISPHLAYQLQQLSLRCGLEVAIHKTKGQNGGKPQWHLSWAGIHVNHLLKFFPKSWRRAKHVKYNDSKNYQPQGRIHNGYYVGRIKSIEEKPWNDLVYNLEVEEDNSYVVEGTAVHNCIMSAAIGLYVCQTLQAEEFETVADSRRRKEEERVRQARQEQFYGMGRTYQNTDMSYKEMSGDDEDDYEGDYED